MAHFIEDFRRLFPKRTLILQTSMLGCFYLFHDTLSIEEKRRRRKQFQIKGMGIGALHQHHISEFKQVVVNNRKIVRNSLKHNIGLLDLNKPQQIMISDYRLENPGSFVHSLQIGSKNEVEHFCLDDLETVKSEFIPDFLVDGEEHETIEMTQSCMF